MERSPTSEPVVPRPRELSSRALASLFFVSGFCTLGFEVIWSAQLRYVLGSATAGVAFTVALFMGGMALGYAVGGRLAKRLRSPVAAYGLAEMALAALSLSNALLLPLVERVGGGPAAYLLACAGILPCTVLAGVTLPFLVAASSGPLSEALGRLYAVNTAGAFLGVIVTGLVLIGSFGLRGCAMGLGALQLAVGLMAFSSSRGVTAPREVTGAATPTKLPAPWLVVAFAVGCASLAEEVLWTRALRAQLNASTYAFSIILAVFLLGLALGAALAGMFLARGANGARWLVGTQLLVGALVLVSPEILDHTEATVPGYVGVRLATGFSVWLGTVGVALGRATIGLLPPCILLGFALPLIVECAATREHDRGATAGAIVGWNTLGSVLGALAAHFVLLPALGLTGGLRVVASLHVLASGLAIASSMRARGWLALPAALLVAVLARPSRPPFLGRLAAGQRTLLIDEGVQDTTAVTEAPAGELPYRTIFSNGISYAGDAPQSLRYMRLLGHLPALYCAKQRRALVICVGTGNTAGAVATHEAFEAIDLVDISPVVWKTLPLFAASNRSVWQDPRVRIDIRDGRTFLSRAASGSYDVITLEPPPPRVAGVSALYSREFYRSAERALAEGGAVAQWLPLHGLTTDELSLLARTFVEVFPSAELVLLNSAETALIATKGLRASDATIAGRAGARYVAEQLRAIGVADPLALPRVALLGTLGTGDVLTDDRPRVEYFAANLPWEATNEFRGRAAFLARVGLRPGGAAH